MARKAAAVADGVGTTMAVFADRAGGGVVVDIDGNGFSTECEPTSCQGRAANAQQRFHVQVSGMRVVLPATHSEAIGRV